MDVSLLMVLSDLVWGYWSSLVVLSATLGGNAQLLAAVEQPPGQLCPICGVVTIEQGLIPRGHDELRNVHRKVR